MALPAIDISAVAALTRSEADAYFNKYARYFKDAPVMKYAIRLGSRTLVSHDTYELKEEFLKKWRGLRRGRRQH